MSRRHKKRNRHEVRDIDATGVESLPGSRTIHRRDVSGMSPSHPTSSGLRLSMLREARPFVLHPTSGTEKESIFDPDPRDRGWALQQCATIPIFNTLLFIFECRLSWERSWQIGVLQRSYCAKRARVEGTSPRILSGRFSVFIVCTFLQALGRQVV